ncbi:vascular cell adhesion protein 1-like [Latimeria chalumnae]|uniref:vascular cell adhesion protein 1-like n=1 Tax=Latimeria chalumnae TaxID=7897 RepID=UPI00313D6437
MALNMILLLLLFVFGSVYSTEVFIYPENPVVEYGGTLTLNCTTTCSSIQLLVWEIQMDHKPIEERGTTWVHITSEHFTKWDATPSCLVNCADGSLHQEIKKVSITVYKLPAPGIHLMNNITEGKDGYVNCTGSVFLSKVKDFEVSLRLKSRNRTLESITGGDATLLYHFIASPAYNGMEFVCESELNMSGKSIARVSKLEKINVFYGPRNFTILRNQTKVEHTLVIEQGSNVTLECRANGNPVPKYRWILPGNGNKEEHNSIITISKVTTENKGEYKCVAKNEHGSAEQHITVEVPGGSNVTTAVVLGVIASLVFVGLLLVIYFKFIRK